MSPRYAIVQPDGAVSLVFTPVDLESIALNTPDGCQAHPVPADADIVPGEWQWTGERLVKLVKAGPTIAEVEAALLREIKNEAELLKMQFASPGGMKKAEYAGKAAEVAAWDATLSGGVVATAAQTLITIKGWSADKQAATFPWALADAKERGDTIDKAVARFRAGIARSSAVHAIAAREGTIVDAIKAAKTIELKRAARSAAKWPV